jgi:thiol-disulfide isomerase/thioredoxin
MEDSYAKYHKYKLKYENYKKQLQKAGAEYQHDIDDGLKKKIILFYADWCVHCNNFKSHWNELKNDSSLSKTYVFEKYNIDNVDNDIKKTYGVESVPSLYIHDSDDLVIDYDKSMNYTNIKNFLQNYKY